MKTIKEAKQRTLNPFPVAISSMHLLYLSRLGGFSLEGIRISMHAKLLQSCPTLCDPIDGTPPASSVPGILQARTLEWLPLPPPMHACMLSCFSRVRLCATLWTVAHQALPSTGFSRQEYWSRLPFPSPYSLIDLL